MVSTEPAANDPRPAPSGLPGLPGLQLDALLAELAARLTDVMSARDRVHGLLEAVMAIGENLDLPTVLLRIVQAGARLADARYAALGMIGANGQLVQFLTVGMDDDVRAQIGDEPKGLGLLGELITHPQPLRLDDLTVDHRSVGFPPNHPPMHSFLGVPIRARDQVLGNLYLTEKTGGGAFDDDDEHLVSALAAAAAVAIENARLYTAARRREAWLAASADLTTSLLSGADPDEVVASLARQIVAITGANVGFVAFPDGKGHLMIEVAHGAGAGDLLGRSIPIGDSLAGDVAESGGVRVSDNASDEVFADAHDDAPAFGHAVVVAVGSSGAVQAVLGLAERPGTPGLTDEDIRLLGAFAAQASVAVQLAQSRADTERMHMLADRDRIARDLHDLVIQRLFATGLSLSGVARSVGDTGAADRIRRSIDDLDETIREIRTTIYALQDGGSDKAGVRGRVLGLVEDATATLGMTPSVRLGGPIDAMVSEPVADHMLAVLREALSNISRHAAAQHVDVICEVADGHVRLIVRDDGRGLPEGGRRSGLANAQARAGECGGTFSAGRGPSGVGTELVWSAPVG